MGRKAAENPKSSYLTIRITEELDARIKAAHTGAWANFEKQRFAAFLIEKGLERLDRLAELEKEESKKDTSSPERPRRTGS